MRFKDKVVIITGGSEGIGLAIAKAFFREGAKIALISRSREKLEKIQNELSNENNVLIYPADVSDSSKAKELVDLVMETWGRVNVLVNNAGITDNKLLLRMDGETWDRLINVNLKGVFNYSRAVLRPMMRQREGVIVNVSSVVGMVGNPGQTAYSASKAGIIAFTKSLAKEVGSRNIRVVCIAPGFVMTKMTESLPDEIKNDYLSRIALRRFATPDEVARVVLFVSSEDASYITGQTIIVDGGMI